VKSRLPTDALLLAGVCGFLFFYQLGIFGLVGADEPRYAQVAREMLARRDWITPVLGGKVWLEKPILYYWQAMLAYVVLGVRDYAARVPSAFDATLMVVASYIFLRRLRRGSELDGALIIASLAGTIGFARAAATDMPLTSMLAISMMAWYGWRESGERRYLAIFYIFVGLATLAKGPVAPFLAGAIILVFAAVVRDWRLPLRVLWWPGLLLFLAVTVPWYVAVQVRNPEFFRVFILEHNLARFSTDLYRHTQPFWYFIPVALLGLIPWTVLILAAVYENTRVVWAERKYGIKAEDEYNIFLLIWLFLPIVFFSISNSKLPGYILPALPAGALLLAEYVRRRLTTDQPMPAGLAGIHALVAAGILVPALLVGYIFGQDRSQSLRNGPALAVVWLLFAAGITFVLARRHGMRYLHFVTLVPVVLAVSALLRIGGPVANVNLSQRPVANDLLQLTDQSLPVAVLGVPRDKEYGLAFYRNMPVSRYERGEVPAIEHLLVVPENSQGDMARYIGDRPVLYLGHFLPQHIEYYRVAPRIGH
jgi:4-amino-4-deoxy-L-arabinose transferase-like glycosyltransferase